MWLLLCWSYIKLKVTQHPMEMAELAISLCAAMSSRYDNDNEQLVGKVFVLPLLNPTAVNQWKTPLSWKKPQPTKETNSKESPPLTPRRAGTVTSVLGESLLQ
ncbi:hypothetical protein EVAR_52406_1 [Eumeta japonica]|uniref:Uncharacterized protein n=1 Tax=Eumeta variegata TaxID=151549 RepID=A0A4C1Z5X5_EUMVA|nr:hypothetical protein EVAR_52406_1 [Eumeta japonica]